VSAGFLATTCARAAHAASAQTQTTALTTRAQSRHFILISSLGHSTGFHLVHPQHARDEAKIRPRVEERELKKTRSMVRNPSSNRGGPKVANDAFHMRMIQKNPESTHRDAKENNRA
jgi:hypothetical protein